MRGFMRTISPLIVVATLIAGCGKDEDQAAPATSVTSTKATTSAAPTTTKPPSVNDSPAPGPSGFFRMDGPAPIENATYDSMPYVLPLDPAGPQESMVRWVDGLGVSPTNATEGTVYVLGHAWGHAQLVFNPISEFATAHVNLNAPVNALGAGNIDVRRYPTDALNGSRITMTDSAGNLREWVVDNTYLIDKYDAINDFDLLDETIKNRIVLIACATSGGADLEYNVIVTGHLA